jgi:hypothetical protein
MRRYHEITVLYVSPDGKGDGYSQVRPLSGLNAAFRVVEEMRGGGMLQPIVIRMMGGEYLMSSPLTISNPVYSVTVEPYDESPVIISGGKKITGFEPSVFNGVPCYAAYIEEVKNSTWYFTYLYVNGLRASLTRYPDQGYLYKLGEEVPGRELFAGSKWFIAKKEDIKDFKNINDCIVSFCHYWIDEHSPIESYDKETGRLTLKYRSRFEIHGNIGYYIENVAEQFKNPGEWYLDRPSGMLYYIPRSDEEALDRIEAYAPVTATLVNINGAPSAINGVTYGSFHSVSGRFEFFSKTGINNFRYTVDVVGIVNGHKSGFSKIMIPIQMGRYLYIQKESDDLTVNTVHVHRFLFGDS